MQKTRVTSFLLMLLMTAPAWAQSAPGGSFIRQVWEWLTGDVGLYTAAIGLAVTGLLFFFNRVQWERAVNVCIGIIILFGSLQMVGWVRSGIGE
jgi:type IV secretory pathway VirB2 component (pilin)